MDVVNLVDTQEDSLAPVDPVVGFHDGPPQHDNDGGDAATLSSKGLAGQAGRVWPLRWTEPGWNWMLLKAAVKAGVHRVWRSGKTHGKLAPLRDAMHATFVSLSASLLPGKQEEPLSARYMWRRLEHVVSLATQAEDIKESMNPTQWEGFLNGQPVRKGQPGWKRYETLHEYCSMFSYLQAGEDDSRFPTDPSTVEAAQEAFRHLEDLVVSYRQMLDGKEQQKAANNAAAKKLAKKDSDGIALER